MGLNPIGRERRKTKELDQLQVFLPRHLILQYAKSKNAGHGRPSVERDMDVGRSTAGRPSVLSGSFLFADISGFTALSENFSKLGTEGAERIAEEISRCFEPLLDRIDRFGGSVLRFGGDALLVYFAGELDGDSAVRAHAAATEIVRVVRRMKPVEAPGGRVKLGVKVGLHAGKVLGFAAELGGGRREYVTLGAALNALAECESAAGRWQIVASPAFHRALNFQPPGRHPSSIGPLARKSIDLYEKAFSHAFKIQNQISIPAAAAAWMRGFLPEPVATRQAILGERTEWMAEMRKITPMFINVVGLGRLADLAVKSFESGDPAWAFDSARRIEAYFSAAREAAIRHGGFFFASDLYDIGDKLILIFGAPVSHERDEEHAIDAAREIMSLPEKLGLPLRQKIGLNSGQAFCGMVGGKRRRVYTVMGDTVNTAARCMSAAGWRDIYVHETTFARARGRFWGPKRQFAAKGKSKPVPVYAVRRELPSAIGKIGDTLIGREEEKQKIETAFSSGKGFMLVLSGEAGVGKSTLLGYASNLWRAEGGRTADVHVPFGTKPSMAGGRVVQADCLPYGISAPFFLWRRAIWNFFKLGDDPTQTEARRALRGLSAEEASILADMIGVDIGIRAPRLEPRQAIEKRWTILEKILKRDPKTLWVFEDIYWVDANSADFLRRLATSGDPPCRMIMTQRPEKEIFAKDAKVTSLGLKPFTLKETEELAGRILGSKILFETTLKDIHAKSDGNPFYLTEIFRFIYEKGLKTAVPDSIQQLLHSRVDMLPESERQILRAASVIGRAFFMDLLQTISPVRVSIEQLRDVLKRLETSGFVNSLGPARFEFRHALTQESIYESVTTGLKRALHKQIARQLERRKQVNLSILAHHYDRAGIAPKAIRFLDAAGKHAESIYANHNALQYYTQAIQWFHRLPKAAAERRTSLSRSALGRPWPAPEPLANIHLRRANVLKNLGRFMQARADYHAAEQLFQKSGNRTPAALARDAIGICLQREGRHAEARKYSEQALAILRRTKLKPDAVARCLNSLTIAYWYSGQYRRAIGCGEESIRIRRRQGDPETIARGLFSLSNSYNVICDFPKALERFHELFRISKQQVNDPAGVAYAQEGLGIINRKTGNFGESLRLHRESFRIREKIGNRRSIVYSCTNEAAVYLTMGLPNTAQTHLDRAQHFLKETDEQNLAGEIWRYRGIVALQMNHLYRAAICLERALRIAQATGFRESEVKALAPLASVTFLLGDRFRAAAICDRLGARAHESEIMDYAAWADIIAGDIAAHEGDQDMAGELWGDAIHIARAHRLDPILLEAQMRRRKWLGHLAPAAETPDALLSRMSEGLDDFDRRAFESRWRVLLG